MRGLLLGKCIIVKFMHFYNPKIPTFTLSRQSQIFEHATIEERSYKWLGHTVRHLCPFLCELSLLFSIHSDCLGQGRFAQTYYKTKNG